HDNRIGDNAGAGSIAGSGITVSDESSSSSIYVLNNIIGDSNTSIGDRGIAISVAGNLATVAGNVIANVLGVGIEIKGASGGELSGNSIALGDGATGIRIDSATIAIGSGNSVSGG